MNRFGRIIGWVAGVFFLIGLLGYLHYGQKFWPSLFTVLMALTFIPLVRAKTAALLGRPIPFYVWIILALAFFLACGFTAGPL